MQRIGLVLKSAEEHAIALAKKISEFLRKADKEVLFEESWRDLVQNWEVTTTDSISDEADLLVVLGGDGTMLHAAALLNSKTVPVVGINLGRVGYMAEIAPREAVSELRAILEGSPLYVERMMLQVTLESGDSKRVLNDAVIHWGTRARLIDLGIRVDNGREIELRADGLIVSTPIGSSAYSYAAGGPVVHPEIEATVLTPICPYSGMHRPLLVPSDREIELLLHHGEELILTLDGHTTMKLMQGESIRIAKSQMPFVMVKSKPRDYFAVLNEKLGFV